MRMFIIPALLLGLLGVTGTQLLPEGVLQDCVNYIFKFAFAGGVVSSAALFAFFEKAKGNTKILLLQGSLKDIEKLRLAQAIKRRSYFLWRIQIVIILTIGVCWGMLYCHSRGYVQPYLLYASFIISCMSVTFLIPAFMAWRDYNRAKEILDNRDANIPDME